MNFQTPYNPSSADARPPGALDLDPDIDRALDELRRAFPELCIWYGEFCGSLWALLPDRLVEAKTAADLARQLYGLLGRPRSQAVRRPSTPSTRRPDGTWNIPAHAPVRRTTSTRRPLPLVGRLVASVLRAARMSAWPVPLV